MFIVPQKQNQKNNRKSKFNNITIATAPGGFIATTGNAQVLNNNDNSDNNNGNNTFAQANDSNNKKIQ